MEDKILVTRSSMPPFEEYVEMIKGIWDSHWMTNMGVYHKKLEGELRTFFNVENVALTVNGHMALELAIQMMDFPEGAEVITTPFTFISTTHAIIRNRLKPVFCDIKDDFTIDEKKIEDLITDKTVAIVPVHTYGNICNVEKIEEIAYKYDLKVIYDAAHSFGEEYKGKNVASFGDASIFSFHATKVFNTIEGGAVCSANKDYYEKIYNLKNFGIRSEETIVSVGANAKMNEFQAAMGLCNLKHIEAEIEKRKAVVELYNELLADCEWIRLNKINENIKSNFAYYPVVFDTKEIRDNVYTALRKKNIYARKYFYPVTADAACFKNKYKKEAIDKARYYSDRVLVLPLYSIWMK
ncbi:MAG: DegT/DnrJ/EryC1/StrS family aminotransferase [Lachnospiraceae bacterium]|nr:DegT/DnrJ/EryC1/StrS family aminotransferase [Lachnospiraceae bacterium]